MRVLSNMDYKLLEYIVKLDQNKLHKIMRMYLRKYYQKVIVRKKFIFAIGDIPIALVAHMDTVHPFPVKDLFYDKGKGVLWSPDGIGGDDRAGVFAIIKIIQSGLRPSIILTTDEEIGGIGASALSKYKCPISLKYLIQLDRCGTNDCVFYCCDNQNFIKYVEQFGFLEHQGSFSDICYLMPAWNICGVNLSVGYKDEHTLLETIWVNALYDTIKKVIKMLKDVKNIEDFIYIEDPRYWGPYNYESILDSKVQILCSGCNDIFNDYDVIPAVDEDGSIKYFCPDCAVDHINWCNLCGRAYVKNKKFPNICPDCRKKEEDKR